MSSLYARKALLPSGWAEGVRFEISAGRIESADRGASLEDDEFEAGIVIPGICNAHSHAFQRALVGRTERRSPAGKDNFWTWRHEMYRLANAIDPDTMRVIARQVYTEMLAAGYTTVAEFHYLHQTAGDSGSADATIEAIISAAEEAGIRLTFVPILYERADSTVRSLTMCKVFLSKRSMTSSLSMKLRKVSLASVVQSVSAPTVCGP